MEFEQHERNGVLVVRIFSRKVVHSNSDEFKAEMTDLIRKGGKQLLLDLSEVEFIDSRGLGVFISILKSVGPGGSLALCSLNDNVYKVFELTKLDKFFAMYADIDSAIRAMRGS